ncbi:MAG: TRAM domain-containing protein [Actinomycetota bacterium]|nr:TRAM domain-containing protein [Actinomycetota bacterium]
MFVEVVRLLVVFLATAGGLALGRGPDGAAAGNAAVVGATLGACVGYVGGGMLGRLLAQAMGVAERRLEQQPAHRLVAGALGAAVLAAAVGIVLLPIAFLLPARAGWAVVALFVWTGAYQGFRLGARKSDELLAMAGLSSRPLVRVTPYEEREQEAVLVDTSAVLDGRLLGLARAGFLHDALLVPRFVLDEVQAVADAADAVRRRRGRQGLEVLEALQHQPGVTVQVLDDEVPEHEEVDAKLVALARRLRCGLLTLDEALQRVAELQGVRCLSLSRLADGVRPVHVPGDVVRVPISREGREPGQGVGFLDDGTMVVVGDAAGLVGRDVTVRITGNARTSLGRMLFATVAAEG